MKPFVFRAVWLASLGGIVLWTGSAAAETSATAAVPSLEVAFARPLETLPFVISDDLAERYRDRGRVKEILDFRGPKRAVGIGPNQVEGMSEERFSALAGELAVAEILWATAVEEGFPETDPALLRELQRIEARLPAFVYYRQTVLARVGEPTEQDLQTLYERHGDQLRGEKGWSFDEARPRLISRWTADRREELDGEEVLRLLETYADRVTIYDEVLRNGEVPPYATLFEVGDFRVAGRDLANSELKTPKELKQALARLRSVGAEMRRIAAEENGLSETPEFAAGLREAKIDLIAGAYLAELGRRLVEVREEELRALYRRSRERFRVPEQVDLHVISKSFVEGPDESSPDRMDVRIRRLKRELRERTADVTTLREFKALAIELSDDPHGRANGGAMGRVPVTYRDGLGGLLESLAVGEVSPPVRVDDTVRVFFAVDRKPAFHRTYEEVKGALTHQYRLIGTNRLYERLLEFLPERAGL